MPSMTNAPLYPHVAHASTLGYKDRLELKRDNGEAEHARLWVRAYTPTVWERLMDDAGTRHLKRASSTPYMEGLNASFHKGNLSGFNSNTSKAVYTHTSFKSGLNPHVEAPLPGTMEHPLLHKRYMHKHRIDYLSYIRPDTETSTQTHRMLGTYEPDKNWATKAHIHIPPITPGSDGYYHPDVRVSMLATTRSSDSLKGRRTRPVSAYPVMQSAPTGRSAWPVPMAANHGVVVVQQPGAAKATAGPAASSLQLPAGQQEAVRQRPFSAAPASAGSLQQPASAAPRQQAVAQGSGGAGVAQPASGNAWPGFMVQANTQHTTHEVHARAQPPQYKQGWRAEQALFPH